MKISRALTILITIFLFISCNNQPLKGEQSKQESTNEYAETLILVFDKEQNDKDLSFEIDIPSTARYKIEFFGQMMADTSFWLEDHIDNQDGRQYDISGPQQLENGKAIVYGSPLAKGVHQMKLHILGVALIDSIRFEAIQQFPPTPNTYTQNMQGDEWRLVWSDEFDSVDVDTSKWAFNLGDWGWGNKELQNYTDTNSRVKEGNLIIRAVKDSAGNWTSARLTTQGKAAFLYGKVVFRAKVPTYRGLWSAGWLLGDQYRDELSWPYCGEIDVLECVGYEIDDESGDGINHATCHTPKYYFKKNNQIGSEIKVPNMNQQFHEYSIEWDSTSVRAYLDGKHYYTYDKNQDELEWPFYKAQNIIVNLAVGGGWGGLKGIDPNFESAEYVIDYIRVYERL